MPDILCNKSNEFVYYKDGSCFVGVTPSFVKELGEVLLVNLPQTGEQYSKGEIFGFIEAEKAASELFMPVTGRVEEINTLLNDTPNKLNSLPIEDCWLIKISAEFFDEDKKDLLGYNSNM